MYSMMETVDLKMARFKMKTGKDPEFIVMGRKSFLELCKESALLGRKELKNALIAQYRCCQVIVVDGVDIMAEIAVSGDESRQLLMDIGPREANA